MISIELQLDVSEDIDIDGVTDGNYEGQKFLNSGEHVSIGGAVDKIKHMIDEIKKSADVSANPVSKKLPVPGNLSPFLFTNALILRYTFNSASKCRHALKSFAIDREATLRTNALNYMRGRNWYLHRQDNTLVYEWNDSILDTDIIAAKATVFMAAIAAV